MQALKLKAYPSYIVGEARLQHLTVSVAQLSEPGCLVAITLGFLVMTDDVGISSFLRSQNACSPLYYR